MLLTDGRFSGTVLFVPAIKRFLLVRTGFEKVNLTTNDIPVSTYPILRQLVSVLEPFVVAVLKLCMNCSKLLTSEVNLKYTYI